MGRRFAFSLFAVAGCLARPSASPQDATGSAGDGPGHASRDGATTDAELAFRHVGIFQDLANPSSFTAAAQHAGDAVVFHLSCGAGVEPVLSIQAPTSWNAIQLARGGQQALWAVAYGAIAPDTSSATFAVFVPADCGATGSYLLADEFANTDPAGGMTTFDSATVLAGGGACFGDATTGHADDAVWAACTASAGAITGPSSGSTIGVMGSSAATEYRTTTDPSSTFETSLFAGTVTEAVVSSVTIKTL